MSRASPFSVGRRWRCVRAGRPTFDFVILGPGDGSNSKLCRLEMDMAWYRKAGQGVPSEQRLTRDGHGIQQSYTHKHLKKHAVLVEDV